MRKAKPLTSQRCLLLLTTQCMYVQQATNGSIGKAAKCYPLKFLRFVFRRTRCLRPGALELIFAHLEERDPATEGGASGGLRKKRVKTLLLDFDDLREREEVACALHKFLPQCVGVCPSLLSPREEEGVVFFSSSLMMRSSRGGGALLS